MAHIFPTGANPLRMDFEIHRTWAPSVVVTRTLDLLVYEESGYRFAFTGSGFTYDADGQPSGGWISSFEYSRGGTVLYSQAGLNLSPTVFAVPNTLGDHIVAQLLLPGNDHLHGSRFEDWLGDRSGHNYIEGGGGKDTIVGGDGNDHLYGHSPNGGADDADHIEGGAGSDYIQANAGKDLVLAGDGADRVSGGADDDLLFGDIGNDSINGNRGNDAVHAGDGDDLLRGGQGNDSLNGGPGDDTLVGDKGADQLFGDNGVDLFIFGPDTSAVGSQLDSMPEFQPGEDHISLGFRPSVILSGTADPYAGAAVVEPHGSARALAQRLCDERPGGLDVAIIAVGYKTIMFWDADWDGAIDSAVELGILTTPQSYSLSDFI